MRACSEEIYRRSCAVMPGGVNSPVRSFRSLGINPLIVERGEGDRIFDADGRSYIDYCGSWGAAILGHAHPEVVESAILQMRRGSTFGIATEIEEKLASRIVSIVPSVDKIRFVSSGTEATMSAIRLARGFTKRAKVIKFAGCYHGHSDALLTQAGSGVLDLNPQATSLGVTAGAIADTIVLPFNDPDAFLSLFAKKEIAEQIACVIIEPIPGNMGVVLPKTHFLHILRKETERIGAVLLFDEVISGFRVSLTGAQGIYDICPDLSCFGKIIGGGFPAAAFGGKREIMDLLAPLGQVYQAGTLSGNPVAMQAGFTTLLQIEVPGFYHQLLEKTNRLTQPIREVLLRKGINACLNQAGSMFTLFFGAHSVSNLDDLKRIDSSRFAHFFRYLFEQGIYIPPLQQETCFVSMAHTHESLDFTADRIVQYLEKL